MSQFKQARVPTPWHTTQAKKPSFTLFAAPFHFARHQSAAEFASSALATASLTSCFAVKGIAMLNHARNLGALAAVLIALSAALCWSTPVRAAAGDSALRARLLAAYQDVRSYKITVLGSVKSSGAFVAPNRYEMLTQYEGKLVKSIFIGGTLWIYGDGKWQKQSSGNGLDYDVEGILRSLKAHPQSSLTKLPPTTRNGKTLGTFSYTFPSSGDKEVCNYDPATYLVVRCKAEELTILYSGYNDPSNTVGTPK
jgi:hypothetical protein